MRPAAWGRGALALAGGVGLLWCASGDAAPVGPPPQAPLAAGIAPAAARVARAATLAQVPAPGWSKRYGWTGHDELLSVNPTLDGGYVAAGLTYQNGDADAWILKLDAAGAVAWSKVLANPGHDRFVEAVEKYDVAGASAGYIAAGHVTTQAFGDTANENAWIVRFDPTGQVLWSKQYGGAVQADALGSNDRAYRVLALPSGYLFVGWTASFHSQPADRAARAWVGRLDESGALLWSRLYPAPPGAAPDTMADFIMRTKEEPPTFIISAINLDYDDRLRLNRWDTTNGFVFKIDAVGRQLWRRWWNQGREDRAWGAHETANGDYLVSGFTRDSAGTADMSLVRFSPSGSVVSSHRYGSAGTDELVGLSPLAVAPASQLVYLAGLSAGADRQDALLMQLDPAALGQIRRQHTYGYSTAGPRIAQFNSLRIVSDGFLLGGHSGGDGWVVKLAPDLAGACAPSAAAGHTAGPGVAVQLVAAPETEALSSVSTAPGPTTFGAGPGEVGSTSCQ
ncbi:MAG TPA: hypothetical protein VFN74_08930 [Chloroflexota bacterium]|nr:hypothetical protein [Chloroflexota bacterium]